LEKRYYYISLEDETIAEANGISYQTLYQRVHQYGWDVDRAITQRTRVEVPFHSEWIEVAKANGIKLSLFRQRVRRHGWDEEVAATTPIIPKVESARRAGVTAQRKREEALC